MPPQKFWATQIWVAQEDAQWLLSATKSKAGRVCRAPKATYVGKVASDAAGPRRKAKPKPQPAPPAEEEEEEPEEEAEEKEGGEGEEEAEAEEKQSEATVEEEKADSETLEEVKEKYKADGGAHAIVRRGALRKALAATQAKASEPSFAFPVRPVSAQPYNDPACQQCQDTGKAGVCMGRPCTRCKLTDPGDGSQCNLRPVAGSAPASDHPPPPPCPSPVLRVSEHSVGDRLWAQHELKVGGFGWFKATVKAVRAISSGHSYKIAWKDGGTDTRRGDKVKAFDGSAVWDSEESDTSPEEEDSPGGVSL